MELGAEKELFYTRVLAIGSSLDSRSTARFCMDHHDASQVWKRIQTFNEELAARWESHRAAVGDESGSGYSIS
jgi:hypothetical protein